MGLYQQDILKMDMNRGGFHRSFMDHSIGKNDNIANRIGVELYRNGEPVDLNEASCEGFFLSPAGEHIVIMGQAYGNTAFVDLPQACYNHEGQFTLAIKVIGGGVTGTVRMVDGQIVNTFTDGAVAPVASVPTYQEVLAVFDQMVEAKAGSVRFDITQDLTSAQQQKARNNISGASQADMDTVNAKIGNTPLPTTAQTLTGAIAEEVAEREAEASAEAAAREAADEITRIKFLLEEENIPGTTQTPSFNSSGDITQIVHKQGSTTIRTDVFTFGANSITEVRTLNTGESLTITTNLTTLATTTTYTAA